MEKIGEGENKDKSGDEKGAEVEFESEGAGGRGGVGGFGGVGDFDGIGGSGVMSFGGVSGGLGGFWGF